MSTKVSVSYDENPSVIEALDRLAGRLSFKRAEVIRVATMAFVRTHDPAMREAAMASTNTESSEDAAREDASLVAAVFSSR